MDNISPKIHENNSKHHEMLFENAILKNVCTETIFELLRGILDPEHPYTLEQLNVISMENIKIFQKEPESEYLCTLNSPIDTIEVIFTPTVSHCSLAGIIALCIFYKLHKHVRNYFFIVKIEEETHTEYALYNKQFLDKERVLAAFENEAIIDIIKTCAEE